MDINKMLDGLRLQKKIELDGEILRSSRISVLTLDERWNSLFADIEKTPTILKYEEHLTGLLKKQARLTDEGKKLYEEKRHLLKRIMELTTEAFDQEDEGARKEIDVCETTVKHLNRRAPEIEDELSKLQHELKNANMDLLEHAVSHIYTGILKSKARAEELEDDIAKLREQIQNSIDERERLIESYNGAYQLLHGLLGAKQMEELDRQNLLD